MLGNAMNRGRMAIRVRVPASVANFGPAFDALAVAVALHSVFTVDAATRPAVEVEGEGSRLVPSDARNLAYRAAAAVAERTGRPQAFAIHCHNGIPPSRGLGSSAAAIVGGVFAANTLLGEPLPPAALLEIAADIEGHPDNVAAALFGGAVVLARDGAQTAWTRFLPAWDADIVLAIPDYTVPTEHARRVLADRVPRRDAVTNVGRTGLLVAAMLTGRLDVLETAMADALHQPYRATLNPGMMEVITAARRAGAFGSALSGSGPTIVAVCPPQKADAVGAAMVRAFADAGQSARSVRVDVDRYGAAVM
jgi:homoserine kinase